MINERKVEQKRRGRRLLLQVKRPRSQKGVAWTRHWFSLVQKQFQFLSLGPGVM